MRKWGVLACVMLLAALCGCGRAETVWETVDDGLEQAAVQGGTPMEMVFDVPEGAEQIGLLDDCRVYAHPDGDYEITAQVLPGVDVGAVIRMVSGFAPEQLRAVVRQEGCLPEYSFSWYAGGDGGGRLYRAEILADGAYCYALTCSIREGLGPAYDSMQEQVFASFGLISGDAV